MISKESINYSIRNLKNRKIRSFFTLFSIMIGIIMVFIFLSFGIGLYSYVGELSSSSSADKVVIEPKGGFWGLDSSFSFSDNDLRVVERTSGVYEATGIYFKFIEIQRDNVKKYSYMIGYEPKKPLIMDLFNIGIEKGRELSSGDSGVVLGYSYFVPDRVFSKNYDINDNIEINGRRFRIIGFYESVGSPQDDMQIYVTSDVIKSLYPNETLNYNWIIARVDTSNIDSVVENIERNLRKERNQEKGKEDFHVQTFDDMIESYSSILDIVVGFVILIALISILVSVVNTANTMITSVLERVKEIGIMKSIGAKNSEIFGIFLFESAFLGFVAGVIGVFFGWMFSFIGGRILDNFGYGFLSPAFPNVLFLGCVLFAVLTGAISGIIPAVQAMKINPVEALRYE